MSELTGVGDFNRDGHVDLLARTTATGDLWLYPGTGTSLGARGHIGTGWNTMRDLVGVGDFDRDGFTEVIAVDGATGKLFRYPGAARRSGRGSLSAAAGPPSDAPALEPSVAAAPALSRHGGSERRIAVTGARDLSRLRGGDLPHCGGYGGSNARVEHAGHDVAGVELVGQDLVGDGVRRGNEHLVGEVRDSRVQQPRKKPGNTSTLLIWFG